MFSALITGTLVSDAQRRTGSNSKRDFAIAQVRVPVDGGVAFLASLIAFNGDAMDALLAHVKGDTIAIAGRAELSSWTSRDGAECHGLKVVAERILSPYMLDKKRSAAREPEAAETE